MTRDQLKLAGPTAQVVATQPPPGQTNQNPSMSEQRNIIADHPNSTIDNGTNPQSTFFWGSMQPPTGFSPGGLQGYWTVNQGQWVWSPTTITGVPLTKMEPERPGYTFTNQPGFTNVVPQPGMQYVS